MISPSSLSPLFTYISPSLPLPLPFSLSSSLTLKEFLSLFLFHYHYPSLSLFPSLASYTYIHIHTHTHTHTYIHTYSSCNAETGQHSALQASYSPVSVLQLLWLMLGQLQHAPFIHVDCLVTSTKHTYMYILDICFFFQITDKYFNDSEVV